MNNRYWLFKQHGVFDLQDADTRERESLGTRNRRGAERSRDARNQATKRRNRGIAMAKAYLTAHDPQIAERTRQDVLNEKNGAGNSKPAVAKPRPLRASSSSTPVMLKHAGQQDHLGVRCCQFGQHEADARAVGGQLFSQRTQVVHLVPLESLQVQHQAALAPRQGITDSLSQTLGRRS